MDLIYIAAHPDHVDVADAAGVDRVMVDLEIVGKRERQRDRDTVISSHTLDDVAAVRGRLKRAQLMVRVNPIFEGSEAEIDAVAGIGADIIMLPMAKTADEVARFVALVRGRARTSFLLETSEALGRAEQILSIPGIDEVHVGLNDLHLALGLDFMFEVLAGGLADHLAGLCRAKNLKFGFGGIARLGGGLLPAERILIEHARLGSTQVILSRDFNALFNGRPIAAVTDDFAASVTAIRTAYAAAITMTPEAQAENRARLCANVAEIATAIRARNGTQSGA